MSFGFSIGDVIKIVELSRSLRRQLVDAPHHYKALANDVRNLAQLDEDIEDLLPHRDLSPEQEQKLVDRRRGCETILLELQKVLDGAKELDGTNKGGLRVAWKRLRCEQKDVEELEEFRSRLQLSINGLTLFLEMLSGDKIFEMSKQVDQMNQRGESHEKQRLAKQLLDSIPAVDYESQQQTAYGTVSANTGKWFLTSKDFVDFANSVVRTLLCRGMPGAGKTVIAAHSVENLRTKFRHDKTVAIVPFYFSYDSRLEQSLDAVFGSLLKQLLQNSEAAQDSCQKLWKINNPENDFKKFKPTLQQILNVFPTVVSSFSKVFFVLDALDEYHAADSPNDAHSFTFFTELVKLQHTLKFSLFVTTRENTEIISIFQDCTQCEIRAHDEDINTYIQNRMPELRKIRAHFDLQTEVKDTISRVADGMFLLAKLHMDTLREPITLGAFKKCLRSLPAGSESLTKTYDQAMERINGQSVPRRDLANRILSFLVYCIRGLSIIELLDALAVEPDSTDVDEEMRPDADDIDALCAGLVILDRSTDTVRLVHKTAQDYFITTDRLHDAHTIITETCLTYLCYSHLLDDIYWEEHSYIVLKAESRSGRYPFGTYATTFWYKHLTRSKGASALDQAFRLFLDSPRVQWSSRKLWDESGFPKVPGLKLSSLNNTYGIHLAAALGLHELFPKLLDCGQSLDMEDGSGDTPLVYAISFGKVQTVRFILQSMDSQTEGSSPKMGQQQRPSQNITWSQYHAMYLAIYRGHVKIVQMLIAWDAMEAYVKEIFQVLFTESDLHFNSHPLITAARFGQKTVVKLLMQHWGSWILDASTPSGRAILLRALGQDQIDSFRFTFPKATLSLFTDIYFADTQSIHNISPLDLFVSAASWGSMDLMRRLLPRVTSHPNLYSEDGVVRALDGASKYSKYCHEETLKFLIANFDIERLKNTSEEKRLVECYISKKESEKRKRDEKIRETKHLMQLRRFKSYEG